MSTPRSAIVGRRASIVALALAAFVLPLGAAADGTVQPDPPIPPEAIPQFVSVAWTDGTGGSPDCNCAVMHAFDLEGRIEGHVQLWRSLHRRAVAQQGEVVAGREYVPVHLASYVEGVVGFPLRQYRLAGDEGERGE
jgi:hypothetical protein